MPEYTTPQNKITFSDYLLMDLQVKELKRFLREWRVALLALKSLFLWEKPWHPCAIIGATSILFLLLCLTELNSLTTIAVIGLFLNFTDFIVPVVCNSIFGPKTWTGHHEKNFDDICRRIVTSYNKTKYNIRSFYSLRKSNPGMYYTISISMLCTLGCVTYVINNLFLLYNVSLAILLWPGIQKHDIFNSILSSVKMGPKKLFPSPISATDKYK